MASRSNKRIPPDVLEADRQVVVTLQSLNDYSPRNPAYSLATLQQQVADLTQAQEAEMLAQRALDQARGRLTATAALLHTSVLGAKAEVIVQYGSDSPALHAIGYKQKSEHRRPARRSPPAA